MLIRGNYNICGVFHKLFFAQSSVFNLELPETSFRLQRTSLARQISVPQYRETRAQLIRLRWFRW